MSLRFGVELETTIPALSEVSVGRYHAGNPVSQLPGFEGGAWKAERDGSIRTIPGRQACEFVSPVLRGAAGIENLATAIRTIRDQFSGAVNDSCGVHVTVEFNGDTAALARLIRLFANFETALYGASGTIRREHGRFCKKVKGYGTEIEVRRRCSADRYHGLNLTHLANGRNRVEFRVFSGSLNAEKIVGWVAMCLAIVETALDGRIRPFEHSTPETAQQCMKRFFATMNWVGVANQSKCRGYVLGTNPAVVPARPAVRKALMKLAEKYDTEKAESDPSGIWQALTAALNS